MNNIYSRFDSMKSYVPSLFTSSKEKVSEYFSLLTQSESDYLTKAENTESDIKELLKSKMEMEVILGLKFLMVHILKGKDISKFHALVVNLLSSESLLVKKLCLNLIDWIALEKQDVLILLYNSVSKKINNNDPLQRWDVIHLIASMKNQAIGADCSKHIIPLLSDSNPLIRRSALIALVNYIKSYTKMNENICITDEELTKILKSFFSDPHPIIFSTAFWAICELKNSDYFSLGLPEKFVYYCTNLNKVDDFYFEHLVFALTNFFKIFLVNNLDKNFKYIETLFNAFYHSIKHSTNFIKILSSLWGVYEIINSLDRLKLNVISKEEYNLFKGGKRLEKIGNALVKLVICSRNDNEKFLALDLVHKFLQANSKNISNEFPEVNIFSNSTGKFIQDENLNFNVNNLNNYLSFTLKVTEVLIKNYTVFFLKSNELEYISIKKLEILIFISNEKNIKFILDEFKRVLSFPSLNLKKIVIKSIYNICKLNSTNKSTINSSNPAASFSHTLTSTCIEKLIDLLKIKDEGVISQIIISLRKLLLEVKDQTKFVLIYNIKNYKKNVTSPLAKANIIWMISQYIETIPTVSVDFFRRLVLDIENESDDVKSQIIGLAMKIQSNLRFLLEKYSTDIRENCRLRIEALINYAIEKLLWDKNYNLREKARLAGFLIKNNLHPKDTYLLCTNISDNFKKGNKTDNTFNLALSKLLPDFNKKFEFDCLDIDSSVNENFAKICLDDIIKVQTSDVTGKSTNKDPVNNTTNISSVGPQLNVNPSVQNFSGGVNVDDLKTKWKNQLDEFLNNEDEDDYEVEIHKD
jgi:vesicle coat complex subunit